MMFFKIFVYIIYSVLFLGAVVIADQILDDAIVKAANLDFLNDNLFGAYDNEFDVINMVDGISTLHHQQQQQFQHHLSILKFEPAVLDFKEQPIGEPKSKVVNIVNIGSETVKLESISGSTTNFYCSFFKDKEIHPGGNTSFDIYFLAKDLGTTDSLLYINTDKGIVKYTVSGIGYLSEYKMKTNINAKINANSSYTTSIEIYNPNNQTINIVEVFTSDDDLHLELPPTTATTTNSDSIQLNNNADARLWNLKPFESKVLFNLRYIARHISNHTAFVCVKNDLNQVFVITVEIEVTREPGIYSPVDFIDFGTMTHLQEPNSVSIYLTNTAKSDNDSLQITDVYSLRHNPAIEIKFLNVELPCDAKTLTKVAEITFDPSKSKKSSHNYGKIVIQTNQKEVNLHIPFNTYLYTGAIDYEIDEIKFFLPIQYSFENYFQNSQTSSSSYTYIETNKIKSFYSKSSNTAATKVREEEEIAAKTLSARTTTVATAMLNNNPNDHDDDVLSLNPNNQDYLRDIYLLSDFPFTIAIYNITLGQFARKYFTINNFHSPKFLITNQTEYIFKLKLHQSVLKENTLSPILEDRIYFYTNFTMFHIPVYLYNGLLTIQTANDNEIVTQMDEFNFELMPVNSHKEILFAINNSNPIDIRLMDMYCTYNNSMIKPLYYETFNKTIVKLTPESSKTQLKVLAQTKLVFSLRIKTSKEGNSHEYEFGFKTKYQHYSIPVLFQTIKGALEVTSTKVQLVTFPSHVATYPLTLKNTFDKPIQINSIEFSNFGAAFFFKWPTTSTEEMNVIKSNKSKKLGHICFDASLICKETSYVGLSEEKTIKLNDIFNNNQTTSVFQHSDLLFVNRHANKTAYELWTSSFSLDNKTYEIDRLLFNYYYNLNWIKKWKQVNLNLNYEIKTKLTLEISNFTQAVKKGEPQQQHPKNLNYNLMNVNVKYKWPKLVNLQTPVKEVESNLNLIKFPLTQIGSFETKNITLVNPSNVNSLLVQLVFLENYPLDNKQLLLDLLKNELNFDDLMDDIQLGHPKQEAGVYSFHYNKHANQGIAPLTKFKSLHLGGNKETLLFLLQKSQQVTLQVQFCPLRKQAYSTLLLLRNNLTIVDSYVLHGEGGSGELRLNNRKPNTKIPLIIEMTAKQYKHCEIIKNRQLELYIDNEDLSNEIVDHLTLRKSFKIKNYGNLQIYINEIHIDKIKCSAYGFEIGKCRDITLEPNQTYELDITYQPDFTMSKIAKQLEFETNLGIFKYELHVKIPKSMLNLCHQVLPRPKFEKYFYYFAITLIIMFICILIIVAIFESRNVLRYHFETRQTLNDQHQKQVNLQEFVNEYQLEKSYLITSQKKNLAAASVNTKAKGSLKQQQSNLNKQLSAGSNEILQNATTTTTTTVPASKPGAKAPLTKSLSSPRSQTEQNSSENKEKKQQQQLKKQPKTKDESPSMAANEVTSSSSEQLNQPAAATATATVPKLSNDKKLKQLQQPSSSSPSPPPPLSPSALSTSSSSSSSSKQEFSDSKLKLVLSQNKQFANNKKQRKEGISDEPSSAKPPTPPSTNSSFTNKLIYNANRRPAIPKYIPPATASTAVNNSDEYHARYIPQYILAQKKAQLEKSEATAASADSSNNQWTKTGGNEAYLKQPLFKLPSELNFDANYLAHSLQNADNTKQYEAPISRSLSMLSNTSFSSLGRIKPAASSNYSSNRNSPLDPDYYYCYHNYNADNDNNSDSRSEVNSTPVSDIWYLPNSNDDENAVDNDEYYNNMVQQTEDFMYKLDTSAKPQQPSPVFSASPPRQSARATAFRSSLIQQPNDIISPVLSSLTKLRTDDDNLPTPVDLNSSFNKSSPKDSDLLASMINNKAVGPIQRPTQRRQQQQLQQPQAQTFFGLPNLVPEQQQQLINDLYLWNQQQMQLQQQQQTSSPLFVDTFASAPSTQAFDVWENALQEETNSGAGNQQIWPAFSNDYLDSFVPTQAQNSNLSYLWLNNGGGNNPGETIATESIPAAAVTTLPWNSVLLNNLNECLNIGEGNSLIDNTLSTVESIWLADVESTDDKEKRQAN